MDDKIGRRKKKKFSVTSVYSVFYFLTTEVTEGTENNNDSIANRNIRNTLDDALHGLLFANASMDDKIG